MFSFPRELRLINSYQYRAVYQEKKKLVTKGLVFHIKKNMLNHPRLGLSIPKRSIRFAVDRNRVRRINKEHFRFRQKELLGFDIVVVVKNGVKGVKDGGLFECLGQQWDCFLGLLRKL